MHNVQHYFLFELYTYRKNKDSAVQMETQFSGLSLFRRGGTNSSCIDRVSGFSLPHDAIRLHRHWGASDARHMGRPPRVRDVSRVIYFVFEEHNCFLPA